MKLFNNLRKHIVHKLIRPEDGYTFTGFSMDGTPNRLCYDIDNKRYLLLMKSFDNDNCWTPSLTGGWVTTERSDNAREPSFIDWAWGIVGQLSDEYGKRLNNMSMQDVKRLIKKEDRGELMINKESFCDIMKALDNYWNNMRSLEDVMNVVFEDNMFTNIFDSVMNALSEDLEPEVDDNIGSILYYWMFELDTGRSKRAKDGIDGHPLTTAEELYDYLMWKRENILEEN